MKNKKNGITLIALIITIIVLLILAGVSISLVVGDNGIATKAQKSKTQSMIGDVKEAAEIIRGEYQVNNNGESPTARYIIERLIEMGKIAVNQVKDYGDNNGQGVITVENIDINISGKFLLETFTINGAPYKYVPGWTFAQWINSPYNTSHVNVYQWYHPNGNPGGDIVTGYGEMLWGRTSSGDIVIYSTDVIDSDIQYFGALY